jgi:hypothetical protein
MAHNLRLKQASAGSNRSAEHGKVFDAVRLGGMGLAKAPVRILWAPIRRVREREPGRIDGRCTVTSSPGTSPEAWRPCVANATYRRGARRGRNRHAGRRPSRSRGRGTRGVVPAVPVAPVTMGLRAAKHPSDSRVAAGSVSPTSWTRKASVPSY